MMDANVQDLQAERDVAIDAVRAAAKVCRQVQHKLVTADTLTKKDRSPVTVADFASQAMICAALGRRFAGDVIVGEEEAGELRKADQQAIRRAVVEHVVAGLHDSTVSESQVLDWIDSAGASTAAGDRYWTLDPIDGTKGFVRGGQYAVALALLIEGEVVLGVLGCPNLDHDSGTGVLLVAVKGGRTLMLTLDDGGADGVVLRVTDTTDAAEARFCESIESAHSSHDDAARIAELLGITADPLRMDSQAKYATLARGQAQIYLRLPTRADYREFIWDHAAGMLAVTQAGGQVSDVHGQPLDFGHGRRLETNQGIIATNGRLHDQVVAAVRQTIG